MRPVKSAVWGVVLGTSVAAQQQPLSAIDWLDELAAVPIAQPGGASTEPGIAETAAPPKVDVSPLGAANADAVGLLAPGTTGLPVTLWSASATDDLTRAFAAIGDTPLPALQALYYTLLLAEADAPGDAGQNTEFLLARVAALTDLGAVEPARALVERANPQTPDLFDTWLDLGLLTGTEDAACKTLRETPSLSQSYAKRIFCIARAGDWPTAALTFETATGLGALSPIETTLLGLYLDPETIEITPLPTPPKGMSPLTYRLFEAAGSPLPTNRLPRAFAMADLRDSAAWRSEIEAAERLTRAGALPANQLLGLYTERGPAASGGVWDRVRAIQAFDAALSARDAEAVARTLPKAWSLLRARGLSAAFAELFAPRLRDLDLPPGIRDTVFAITLLSDDYETAANLLTAPDDQQAFLTGVAAGSPDPALARTSREQAIARGFALRGPSRDHGPLVRAGKVGEAILAASKQLDQARVGNLADLTDALATLRALGLEDTARRAALQILILGRS